MSCVIEYNAYDEWMIEGMILVALAGLAAGAVHVYLGVDHLAALLPAVHGRRKGGFYLGVRWGLGHSLGVVVVAICFLWLREQTTEHLDFGSIGLWGERMVGLFLIAFGVVGIRTALAQRIHTHAHKHGEMAHHHLHVHNDKSRHRIEEETDHQSHFHGHASFAAGVLHGFAGMAHLWVVLPSLALPLAEAGLYLFAFALAAMLSMGLFGSGVGYATARLEDRMPQHITRARLTTSGACMAVGAGWLAYSFI